MINPNIKISDIGEHAILILGAVRGGIRRGRLPEATIREDLLTILVLHDGKLNNASAVLSGHNFYENRIGEPTYPEQPMTRRLFYGLPDTQLPLLSLIKNRNKYLSASIFCIFYNFKAELTELFESVV